MSGGGAGQVIQYKYIRKHFVHKKGRSLVVVGTLVGNTGATPVGTLECVECLEPSAMHLSV